MPFESLLSVVTPADRRELTTLAQAAAECRVAVNAFPDGPLLIAAASEAVVAYTGRQWIRETVRETFRGDGRRVRALFLQRVPVVSIASVTVDGLARNLATEIECDTGAGLLYRLDLDQRVEWCAKLVVVEYSGGYLHPNSAGMTVPALVQRATAKIVAGWYHGQGRDPRLRSISVEDVGSKTFLDPGDADHGLPPGIAGLLDPLRRKRLG